MKSIFVSTAIPYVNAEPHIGHALEFIQTDVVARYWRSRGRDVFFLTGADENALKNVQAAERAGTPTQSFVDRNTARFRALSDALSLSITDFIRTTEDRHIRGVQKLWGLCKKDIYKKSYRGLYCVGCEQFYRESELVGGLCPEHKTALEAVEEENYFFRLSAYQSQLEKVIKSGEITVVPEHRKNEVLSFIRSGLEDFSISRSRERAKGWGIPVPGDDSQIIYVWFDALTNYTSALGFADDSEMFKKYWSEGETVHMIGKGISRFHTVYWPAMLLSAGIPLPKKVIIHGYVTTSGEKLSKSAGNTVSPFDLSKEWGVDAVRYFLLREIPPFEDGDYSPERFAERYTTDLAHGLGNLVSRTLTLIAKTGTIAIETSALEEKIFAQRKAYDAACQEFRFNGALEATWGLIAYADRYINDTKPWELLKSDPEEFARVASSLWVALAAIALMLEPFLPNTAKIIIQCLGAENDRSLLTNAHGKKIEGLTRPPNLFPLKNF